jgi:hypothetical protein
MAWRGEAYGTRAPNQALGYDRDARHLGHLANEGMGQVMAGTSQLGLGIGTMSGPGGDWHPTIVYLFALILAEMFVFGLISQLLK